ncbi:hypothetical protein [Spiroplasma alleghenense]|uniref:Uncharacterized protein n=1 Tax=Spiroplasma alleghenense TaxID=216931 RepID=A0A345Z4L6_9MOLU|nr:hypothetical protein [Spiroplasma alleghenense]AXK51545.1 hypothetical protein SALLE_v1c08750 [Spiroplasma alleghenense]
MRKIIPIIGALALVPPVSMNVIKTQLDSKNTYEVPPAEVELIEGRGLALPINTPLFRTVSSGWNDNQQDSGTHFFSSLQPWASSAQEFTNLFPTFSLSRERVRGNILGSDRFADTDINLKFNTKDLFDSTLSLRQLMSFSENIGSAWQEIVARARFFMDPVTLVLRIQWDISAHSRATTSSPWISYEVSRVYFWES